MSYSQRLIIGLIILISSFSLFTGAQERNHFHNAIAEISRLAGCTCTGCYKCIQMERYIVVLVSFTAGITLVMDAGAILAIIAQIGFIALQAVLIRNPTVSDLQPILVNIALLVFLIKNCSEKCAEDAAAKEAQRKAALAAAQVPVEVQEVRPVPKTLEEVHNQNKSSSKVGNSNSKNLKGK